jgi:hypothetical protein
MNGFLVLLNFAFIFAAFLTGIKASARESRYREALEKLHEAHTATRRLMKDAENLLSDSRAIVAEGNEICKMTPRFQGYLRQSEDIDAVIIRSLETGRKLERLNIPVGVN